jgi:hypothetical protein
MTVPTPKPPSTEELTGRAPAARFAERIAVPPPEAPFSEKMAYYRTQHTSRGVKVTHMIGTPVIAAGLPLLVAKPALGVPMFVGGWLLQIAGHRLFEHNLPSTHKGWITYQLTGVIHVCEQYGELLARRSGRKAARKAA